MDLKKILMTEKVIRVKILRKNHLGMKEAMYGLPAFFMGDFPTVATDGEYNLDRFARPIGLNPKGAMASTCEWLECKYATMIAAGAEAELTGFIKPEHMIGSYMQTNQIGFLDGMYQERFQGVKADDYGVYYSFLTTSVGTLKGKAREEVQIYTEELLNCEDTQQFGAQPKIEEIKIEDFF